MEFLQLQYFHKVASLENMSEAASQLNISQPSLSQMIARLEKQVGYPLFDRNGRNIELNSSGKIFLNYTNQILNALENAKLEINNFNNKQKKEVSLYIGCASMVLPQLLQYLLASTTDIQFRIYQWNHRKESHSADLQMIASDVPIKDWNAHLLLTEPIFLALPRGHALLHASKIHVRDLANENFISLNDDWELTHSIKNKCKSIDFHPHTHMFVDNPNLMRELLRNGMGLALVPSLTWNGFAEDGIVMRPVEGFELTRHIYLLQNPDRYLTEYAQLCMAGIQAFFELIVR